MKPVQSILPRVNAFSISCLLVPGFLAGCASAPPSPELLAAPLIMSTTCITPLPICAPCPTCPPATSSASLTPIVEKPATTSTEPVRGRLEKAAWTQLVDWESDDPSEALTAFEQGCSVLKSRNEWETVCTVASDLVTKKFTRQDASDFFRQKFQPFQVLNADDSTTGTVTGYYEPLLMGSRTRTKTFRYPVLAQPQDLISVELSDIYPDLKHRRLRGRIVGNKLVPYYDRADIEGTNPEKSPLSGLEIAWVDNAVELFFLHIQGSGQIQFADGGRMRVGYADQNGHPFRSIAGLLIRRGELRAERASMQGIKNWAERNPRKVQQFMNANPSYVFFKEISADGTGPIGTLGVPLTAGRSIAVDARVIPLGVPVFLSTTFPNSKQPLNRLMVAQDTGGAIAGGVRVDFYWGFGDEAGALAGRMKQNGMKWVLLPNDYNPNAPSSQSASTPR